MEKILTLSDMSVLVIDCQATAANPQAGHLLEAAWCDCCAGESEVDSFLVQIPGDHQIPKQVTRITGIRQEDLAGAVSREMLFEKLSHTIGAVTAANGGVSPTPTVIHFASYEARFLEHFFEEFVPGAPFPLDIVCTHRIVRKLLPQLPRKSLRAVAGYLGFSVDEMRRARHHTEATAFVWRQLVKRLQEMNIDTWDQLTEWLAAPVPKNSVKKKEFLMDAQRRKTLPRKPGVYRMLRSNGDILYIGKATSLRQRVNSYFQKGNSGGHARQIMEMLTQAGDLEVTETGSALEAALLETDLIKEHAPQYNTALRQRERAVAFFSRDFCQSNPTPGSAEGGESPHPIGPLPSINVGQPLEHLTRMLARGAMDRDNPELPAIILGSLPEYTPDMDCFAQGFQLFSQRHRDHLNKLRYRYLFVKNPMQAMMTLGKIFFLEKQAEEALKKEQEERAAALGEKVTEESEESEEPETGLEPEEWVWTPEAVSRALASVIRRGAHMIRRGRWFCLLSESALAWNTGKTAGGGRRLLVFRGAAVAHRADIDADEEPMTPPGYQRPITIRRASFDIAAYDRMRVLNTELRRLLTDSTDRDVRLRLSPEITLGPEQLIKALPWV